MKEIVGRVATKSSALRELEFHFQSREYSMLSSQLSRYSQVATGMKTPSNKINSIEFNLSTQYYGNLIQQIRSIAPQPGRYSHNRPILPAQNDEAPQDWLDIALSTAQKTIYVRLRLDNLYLVGYRMQSGSWREFNRGKDKATGKDLPPLIPGSEFLGFTGSYDALQGAGGKPIKGTLVTRTAVINAVDKLGKAETDRSSIARALALLIMVICEATRFEEMSRRFADVMHSGTVKSVEIEEWMLKLFKAWGDLSGKLIRADADGDQYFRLPSDAPLRARIPSALEAATYVALLLGPKYRPRALLARNSGGDEYVPRGQPMMEVLSVQILQFSGNLSGTFTVTDGLGSQTLFNRSQTVGRTGDTLTLELLNRAISAWQCVDIDYNLTSAQSQYRGRYSWDIFQGTDLYTDKNTSACIRSIRLPMYGARSSSTDETVLMNLGLFLEAYQITWKVKIVNGDGHNPMNVYGSVSLSSSVGTLNYNVKLFSRSSDDCEVVRVGGDVPLLRKAMAVPLDVDVTIDVNLWDYIRGSSAQCIAQRKVTTRFGSANAAQGKFHILKPAGTTKSDVELSYMYNVVSMD